MSGHFYGIGVGPGDPELLTIKAVNALKATDVLAVPESSTDSESIAYSIAARYINPDTEILRLTFPMIKDKTVKNRQRAHNAFMIREQLERGKTVSFITIGDPLTYSTYIYLLEHLKETGTRVTTIPGITSFQAMAAGQHLPLAAGRDSVGIFCDFETLLAHKALFGFDTLILMKPAAYFPRLAALFSEHRDEYHFCLAMHMGREEEKIITDWDAAGKEVLPYLSLIIIRRKNEN